MAVNNNNKLTAAKVACQLDVSTKTLTNWYKFYHSDCEKPDNMPELPEYEQAYEKAPRYWNPEDIPKLMAFKEWIPKGRHGVMGEINITCWMREYQERLKEKRKKAAEAKKNSKEN